MVPTSEYRHQHVREVSLIFDIWYSTNLHHGPCASNATDIVAETQTAGDKFSSRPRPTPYFHFRYLENAAISLRLESTGNRVDRCRCSTYYL